MEQKKNKKYLINTLQKKGKKPVIEKLYKAVLFNLKKTYKHSPNIILQNLLNNLKIRLINKKSSKTFNIGFLTKDKQINQSIKLFTTLFDDNRINNLKFLNIKDKHFSLFEKKTEKYKLAEKTRHK